LRCGLEQFFFSFWLQNTKTTFPHQQQSFHLNSMATPSSSSSSSSSSRKFRFFAGEEGTLDELVFSDIGNLNAFSDVQLSQFVSLLLRFLAGEGGGSQLLAEVGAFAQEHSVNPAALRNTVRGALFFFRGAVKTNLSAEHLKEDLLAFGKKEEEEEEGQPSSRTHSPHLLLFPLSLV
jgi:hypothetical protein